MLSNSAFPAMAFMTPPNASDHSTLRRRGAKIMVYHGVSDPIFSVNDTEAWYRGVDRTSGGRTRPGRATR